MRNTPSRLAYALKGAAGHSCAIACDTDGVDGAAEVAGAAIDPGHAGRGPHQAGALIPEEALLTGTTRIRFFERIGGQVVPGPTLTNVNDFRVILIQPGSWGSVQG
jgi:glycerate 2-kinase